MTANKEAAATDVMEIGPASKTIGVSPSTLRNWEAKGKISSRRTPSGRRVYRREDVLDLAARNRNPGAAVDTASNDEERERAVEMVSTTYSSAAAAVLLNVNLETLRRWRDQGRIKAHPQRLHGQIRYPRADIDAMVTMTQTGLDTESNMA